MCIVSPRYCCSGTMFLPRLASIKRLRWKAVGELALSKACFYGSEWNSSELDYVFTASKTNQLSKQRMLESVLLSHVRSDVVFVLGCWACGPSTSNIKQYVLGIDLDLSSPASRHVSSHIEVTGCWTMFHRADEQHTCCSVVLRTCPCRSESRSRFRDDWNLAPWRLASKGKRNVGCIRLN